jgi:hypothetical protein
MEINDLPTDNTRKVDPLSESFCSSTEPHLIYQADLNGPAYCGL